MIVEYNAPSAWAGLEHFLDWLIYTKNPNLYVEVGVHHGFSYFAACQSIKAHGLRTFVTGIDTWQGDVHANYTDGDEIFRTVSAYNQEHYSAFSALRRMTSVEAAKDETDMTIDILHIDAGHRYQDIHSDFFAWLPKMKKGGTILVHDVCLTTEQPDDENGVGVNRFWNEVMHFFPSFHLPYSCGLGVLTIDKYPDIKPKG